MKTYIITFQSAKNYGAVLQAYALQSYLCQKYGDVCVIDYLNPHIEKSYSIPSIRDLLNNPKNSLFKIMQFILYRGKYEKIARFKEKKLKLTPPCDLRNIKEITADGNVFITGSDQVWNYLITGKDDAYYLGFAKGKLTCSYAASFGVAEIPENYIEFYRNALKNINHISTRELQGINLLNSLGCGDSQLLCDPTLLLDGTVWDKMCNNPNVGKKYILVYKITIADKLLKFAKALSRKTGLPIMYIPNDLKSGCIGSLKLNVGVEEWLGYIKNAEYVVTNSFHGTVFSILFGRKFFSEVSKKVNPSTSRLLSLLEMFNLKERILSDYNDDLLHKELDVQEIDLILKEQRRLTDCFFQKIYNGGI